MMEYERVLRKGIVDADFFKDEYLCDYYVTRHMKKIWAIELDLLLELDKVTKRHGLEYYIWYGTLLGAVRHKGFIPWDDDLDVAMPRHDYEKLLGLANEFKNPYFLQTPFTDKGYYFSFSKLRNSNTTAVTTMFQHEKFNQGIWIDIFPLDDCTEDGLEEKYDRVRYLTREIGTSMRMSNPSLDEENKKRVEEYSGIDPMQAYLEIQELGKECMEKGAICTYKASIVSVPYNREKLIYPMKLFNKKDSVIFEGYSFSVPSGYKNILEILYGDYMSYPPLDKRGNYHKNEIYDPDKPYTEYLL